MFYSQDSLRRKYGKVEFEMSLPHTMEFSVWFILYLHFLSNYFFDHDLITDIRKFEVSSTEVELFISWSNLQLVGDQFWMKPQNLGEMMPNKWLSDAQTFFWKEKTSVQDVATKNKSRLVLNNLDCALKWGRICFFLNVSPDSSWPQTKKEKSLHQNIVGVPGVKTTYEPGSINSLYWGWE